MAGVRGQGGETEVTETRESLIGDRLEAIMMAHAIMVGHGHPRVVQDYPRVVQDHPRVVQDHASGVQEYHSQQAINPSLLLGTLRVFKE